MTVIDRNGLSLWSTVAEYPRFRSLFWLLVLRDIQLRFRHTSLGVAWAVLQPLLPMLIFAALFSRLDFETGGIPYPLFVFSGMAPWMFIGNSVTQASPTFVNNFHMLNKIYFPRAFLPAAVSTALLLDGLVASFAVVGVSVWFGYGPFASWLLLPLVGIVAAVLAIAAAIVAASLTALLRDIKNVVPFLVQIWMFGSPVMYPVDQLPRAVQPLAGFNPAVGVLEAYRAALLDTSPNWTYLAQSAAAIFGVVALALVLFHWLEADLAEQV